MYRAFCHSLYYTHSHLWPKKRDRKKLWQSSQYLSISIKFSFSFSYIIIWKNIYSVGESLRSLKWDFEYFFKQYDTLEEVSVESQSMTLQYQYERERETSRPGQIPFIRIFHLVRYWQNINLFPSTRPKRRPGSGSHSQRKRGQRFLFWASALALLSMSSSGEKKKLLRNDLAAKTTDLTVKHDDSSTAPSSYKIVRNLLTVFGQLRTNHSERRQQHSQIRQKMHWTWIKKTFFMTLRARAYFTRFFSDRWKSWQLNLLELFDSTFGDCG